MYDLTSPLNLKLGPKADACLSGNLAVELTFRDNDTGTSSVTRNTTSSKGKMKAGPAPLTSSYKTLYEDDDPVSDFEPIRDAVDTDAAARPEENSQTRLKAMVAVRQKVKVFPRSSSSWLIFHFTACEGT